MTHVDTVQAVEQYLKSQQRIDCPRCQGKGKTLEYDFDGRGWYRCGECDGAGTVAAPVAEMVEVAPVAGTGPESFDLTADFLPAKPRTVDCLKPFDALLAIQRGISATTRGAFVEIGPAWESFAVYRHPDATALVNLDHQTISISGPDLAWRIDLDCQTLRASVTGDLSGTGRDLARACRQVASAHQGRLAGSNQPIAS